MIKSPLKNTQTNNLSLRTILEKIPAGSVVDTFALFSGQLEISLAEYGRFVCAHTNKYAIFEFWYTIKEEPKRMYDMITSEGFRFDPAMFEILQEKWVAYKDPVVRSALFFMLNQVSDTGQISSGKLVPTKFNRVALANLRTFKSPPNLHFILDKEEKLVDSINSKLRGDYIVVNAGKFSYNLFEDGKSQAYDITKINHRDLKSKFDLKEQKMILIYQYDKRVVKLFNNFCTMIDKYGRPTQDESLAVEVVVANF